RQCQNAAERATALVRDEPTFVVELAEAHGAAAEHFEMVTARLRARSRRHGEDADAVARLIDEQSVLRQLVESALVEPRLRVDSIGVYVLSEQAVCLR